MIDNDGIRSLAGMHGQDHLFSRESELSELERAAFAAQVASLDWHLLPSLLETMRQPPHGAATRLEPVEPYVVGVDPDLDRESRRRGEALLRAGRVAVFVVAGGQGSRLGFEGPKGMYPATAIRKKSLFRLFAEKILALGRQHGRTPPWYVMTSTTNHQATVDYFQSQGNFGLAAPDVRFCMQDMLPAVDEGGRILLEAPGRLFLSPNGHGGALLALRRSGALDDMRVRGIDQIFYFQVDNPLVVMADPLFLGRHDLAEAQMSSKVVEKRDAHEKVGVLGRIDGKLGVIEYSNLSPAEREARTETGELRFRAGNIAIHALKRQFVETLTSGATSLPYHVARKSVHCIDPATGERRTAQGVKFESFVFDALAFCERSVVMTVDRAEEFAPIKNAVGEDSPATSLQAQDALFSRWLEAIGFRIPKDASGLPSRRIEISPTFADSLEALRAKGLSPGDVDHDWLMDG